MPDDLGRPTISDGMKSRVSDALNSLPPDTAHAALLVITHEDGITRGHVAAKIGQSWKVAGGGGFEWEEKKPYGYIALAWSR